MRPHKAQATPAKVLAFLAAALSAALGGCLMQASYSVNVTTADGVTIEVPLTGKFEVNPSAIDDYVEVKNFRFMPLMGQSVKTMAYEFVLQFKRGSIPASIVVDDDSEDRIWSLYEDRAPKLRKGDYWLALTPGFNPNEERMNWLNSLDNGVRVLRFTVTMTDKSVHVLRLPIFVPSQAKAMFRAELGIK